MSNDENRTFLGFFWERMKIHFVGVTILFVFSTLGLIFTPVGNHVSQIWNSPEMLAKIETKVDHLLTEVKKATGEDRVIYEAPGLSYVIEPVYRDEAIILHIVVNRTKRGEECILLNLTPIFTDERNVAFAGRKQTPSRQIGMQQDLVNLELELPKNIRVGRVTVYLSMEFECGNQNVFETTRPVPFMLLERS